MKIGVSLSLIVLHLFCAACSTEPENGKSETEKSVLTTKVEPEISPVNSEPVLINQEEQQTAIITPATQVALDFMNAYAAHCDSMNKAMNTKKWVEINQLISSNFKSEYKKLIEEAYKADPELGLGFDPIFNAQDFPDEGFVLLKNEDNEFVTLQGKDWPEFQLVVKVFKANNNWLVDGAGIINVPEEKRVKLE